MSDLVGYFAIVVVLLLPDAKSLKLGGFQFERLTKEVADQATEIGRIRQDVSTAVTSTNALSVQVGNVATLAFADFRASFREQMRHLQSIREYLPSDPKTAAELKNIDEFAKRIDADDLNPAELIEMLQIIRSLLAAKLTASGTEGDTVVGAQKAEDVLPGILGGDQPDS